MTESVLSMNDFGEPKILKNTDAIGIMIIRLLILNKGSLELHPNMGIGLIENYRHSFSDNLSKLETEIENQVFKYITKTPTNVDLNLVNNILYISIYIDNKRYIFNFNTENNSIKLSDL